ncbi:hypothetical protein GT370_17090 [Acidocella sp. MX-AZ03]|uniref:hypothetical protein n=1 Tax=Acidocella sp. MX-AZ03 TaxID=2697363 RepID=UPI0022DE87EA|nr:hypothetical protein [Acidocella sp. MX-AZ03]WBO58810.1 hypothetical protein GT370_17090 [Acidocella sp. MX-AZ03]
MRAMTDPKSLLALETSPPCFSAEAAAAFARDIFGIDGPAKPLYGERDQNFRITPAQGPGIILKILSPTELESAVDFQTIVLDHIQAMDPSLPVPRVRRTLAGDAYAFVKDAADTPHMVRALDFQPGRVMDDVEPPLPCCATSAPSSPGWTARWPMSSTPAWGRRSSGICAPSKSSAPRRR